MIYLGVEGKLFAYSALVEIAGDVGTCTQRTVAANQAAVCAENMETST